MVATPPGTNKESKALLEVKQPRQPEVPSQAPETLDASERERLRDRVLEEIEKNPEQSSEKTPATAPKAPVADRPQAPKSEELVRIERVLEEDLLTIYASLDAGLKRRFKARGEQVAAHIETMLTTGKAKAKRIFKLIVSWLEMIPGVNKFFVRQEAKIKTDKILGIK